ncbi:nuclear transcription factor Y subunit A-1 [Populus alba]|uniref:nuclear transcription factor Y subunit A-1 n=1 Tax=Populus alba TaxID=43335 RepID=UPI001588EF52|nr:nuclear transcription factor Y subunit A-1-like isoform X1 [Populus alba]
MMPAKSEKEDRRLDHSGPSPFQTNIYSQPWWRDVGNSPSLGDTASKLSSVENLNGSLANAAIQSQVNTGLQKGAMVNKDMQTDVTSQSDESNGQEHHLKHIPSPTTVTMGGHLEPNSQMELVGHSIVLTSHPYTDPQYGGMFASYGAQAMVPQLYGMPHARMPLPLEMEEEPVYVNAKQFHGIMRRRQARAKAELEKKAVKVRKPYLHESRHQHAMRRARGCGGRFLNTKKLDNNATNPTSEKGSGDLNSSGDLEGGKGSQASSNGHGNGMHSHQDIIHHHMMAASWVSKRKPHTGIGCLMELSPFIKLPPRVEKLEALAMFNLGGNFSCAVFLRQFILGFRSSVTWCIHGGESVAYVMDFMLSSDLN